MFSKEAFKAFVEAEGYKYPYNQLQLMQQGYYPKWLLLHSSNLDGIVWRSRGFYVLKSSCLPWNIMQEIIITKSGFPLPPEFSEVVDCMETWGWNYSSLWVQDVLHLMYQFVHPQGCFFGCPKTKESMYEDFIFLYVKEKLQINFGNSRINNYIIMQWHTYYHQKVMETVDYFELAVGSIAFLDACIDVARTQNSFFSVRSAMNVVPDSPVSSSSAE